MQRVAVIFLCVYILPIEQHTALHGCDEPRDELDERGLAAACAAHDADELPVADLKADAAQRLHGKRGAGGVGI